MASMYRFLPRPEGAIVGTSAAGVRNVLALILPCI
jgi:hypothetical protein